MKTDLLLIPMSARYRDMRAAAVAAEEAGLDGFWTPAPPPPLVVGGSGPRRAGIAAGHGDGFNTQAMHPRLGDLARLARDEHTKSGRDAAHFIVTVFAGLDERWLRSDSRVRQTLDRAGVERLILLVEPPFDPEEIRAAGRLLAGTGADAR